MNSLSKYCEDLIGEVDSKKTTRTIGGFMGGGLVAGGGLMAAELFVSAATGGLFAIVCACSVAMMGSIIGRKSVDGVADMVIKSTELSTCHCAIKTDSEYTIAFLQKVESASKNLDTGIIWDESSLEKQVIMGSVKNETETLKISNLTTWIDKLIKKERRRSSKPIKTIANKLELGLDSNLDFGRLFNIPG